MNYSLKTLNAIAICILTLSACKKDNSQNDKEEIIDPTEETIPANKHEAAAKINGKWSISSTGEVQSIEFLDENTYIMQVLPSSPLVANKPPLYTTHTLLAQNNTNNKAENAVGSPYETIIGYYIISEDGKTIKLDNIIDITITGISETSFSFTITYLEDNRKQSFSATLSSPVDASSNTTLISGKWGSDKWASYDLPNKAVFERHGFKPQDQGLTFTSSGTMIMRYISFIETSYTDPETGEPTNTITNLSIESDVYSWKWKDSSQKVITAIGGGDPFDINITTLTQTQLNAKLPNGNTWEMIKL